MSKVLTMVPMEVACSLVEGCFKPEGLAAFRGWLCKVETGMIAIPKPTSHEEELALFLAKSEIKFWVRQHGLSLHEDDQQLEGQLTSA